jgi:hypothetical protein
MGNISSSDEDFFLPSRKSISQLPDVLKMHDNELIDLREKFQGYSICALDEEDAVSLALEYEIVQKVGVFDLFCIPKEEIWFDKLIEFVEKRKFQIITIEDVHKGKLSIYTIQPDNKN